jgi:hypothetical protein
LRNCDHNSRSSLRKSARRRRDRAHFFEENGVLALGTEPAFVARAMTRSQVLRHIEPFAFIVVLCGASLVLSRFQCRDATPRAGTNPLSSVEPCRERRVQAQTPTTSMVTRQRAIQSCRSGSTEDCEQLSALYKTSAVAFVDRSAH